MIGLSFFFSVNNDGMIVSENRLAVVLQSPMLLIDYSFICNLNIVNTLKTLRMFSDYIRLLIDYCSIIASRLFPIINYGNFPIPHH